MGVIGVNWLGDRSDTTNLSFRQEIRVMAVSAEDVATPVNSYKQMCIRDSFKGRDAQVFFVERKLISIRSK